MQDTDRPEARMLTASDLRAIRPFTQAVEYQAGDVVFSEGDEADFIYFVESGRLGVFLQKFTARQELCGLEQGDHFGELAVLNGGRRSASVAAQEKTVLLRADRAAFHRLLNAHPPLRKKVLYARDQRDQRTAIQELLMDRAAGNGGGPGSSASRATPRCASRFSAANATRTSSTSSWSRSARRSRNC